MDALALVDYIFQAGNDLVERCKFVKQCHYEATSIGVRTLHALGELEKAAGEFSGSVPFDASLIALKRVFEHADDLVKECHRPRTIRMWVRAVPMANAKQDELIRLDGEIEGITSDLQIPVVPDIRRVLVDVRTAVQQVQGRAVGDGFHAETMQHMVQTAIDSMLDALSADGRRSVRDVIEAKVSSVTSAEPAGGSKVSGQLMSRQGRVFFDMLEEGEEVLGEGGVGMVTSSIYMGEQVAIKKMRSAIRDPAVLRAFRRELEIQHAMRHENIVRVLAFDVGSLERSPLLVMERMELSLLRSLEASRVAPSLRERLKTIKDICQGLHFLHQHRITHMNVKSQNVLIDQEGTAKLSDIGLLVVESSYGESFEGSGGRGASFTGDVTCKVGAKYYMAPEVTNGLEATSASDVFSVHVLMWEILTHQTVGDGIPIGERLLRSPGARFIIGSSVPAGVREELQALLDQCGQSQPKDRPRVESALNRVDNILHNLHDTPTQEPALPVHDTPTQEPALPVQEAGNDRAALMTLYLATGGPSTEHEGWKNRRGWGTSAPLRDWSGVSVNEEGRVTELNPFMCNLRGVIPSDLGSLAALTVLVLEYNQLSGTIPPELGNLTALTALSLRDNELSGAIPSELGNLTALTGLDLQRNQLSGEIPKELGRLTALSTLWLHFNQLSGAIPLELGNLQTLTWLDLGDNQLDGAIPPELGNLTTLTWLDVRHNQLSGFVPSDLTKLTALKYLGLGGNKLSGSEVEARQVLPGCHVE